MNHEKEPKNLFADLRAVHVFVHFNRLMCDEQIEEYCSLIQQLLHTPRYVILFLKNDSSLSVKPHIYFYFDDSQPCLDAACEASKLRSLFSTEYELDFVHKGEIFYVK